MPFPLQPRHTAATVVALAVLWTVGACGRSESGSETPIPEEEPGIPRLPLEFTNLEVLPLDITKDELKREMKRMTRSLGTKCDHCHRTDIPDYATDELREKRIARSMMRLVEHLNSEHFTWEGAPQATCFMCHHGETEPLLVPTDPELNEAVEGLRDSAPDTDHIRQ